MSFGARGLFDAYITPAAVSSKKVAVKSRDFTAAEKKLMSCAQCPLDRVPLRSPKMAAASAQSKPLAYVFGEAPDEDDDKNGRHFSGTHGAFLRERLPVGVEGLLAWDNVLGCKPGKGPEALEIECCRRRHVADIERLRPPVIIALGRHALQWLMGTDKVMHIWRGRRAPVKVGTHVCWAYFIEHPSELNPDNRKYGVARVTAFERDVRRVFDDIERGLPEPCVEDPGDYYKGIEIWQEYGSDGLARVERELLYWRDQTHGHDIETNMLRPYDPEKKILSLAIGNYSRVFAFGWEHSEARWSQREHARIGELLSHYIEGSGTKWAHSAKFEQEWWHAYFGARVVWRSRWGDTLGQAHVLDERGGAEDKGSAKELGDLTQLHLGFNVKALSPIDRKKLASTPLHYVLPYNALDTKYCYVLSAVQAALLMQQGLTHVYERLNSYTPALVTLQAKGCARNMLAIKRLDEELRARIEPLQRSIHEHPDVVALRRTGRKFSPTSDQDLVFFFRDWLKIAPSERNSRKEKYSVDGDALSQMGHPIAAAVMLLRKLIDNHSYVTPLLPGGKYVHADGLSHSTYSQYITGSGRLSSRGPNDQNYPRRGPEAKTIRQIRGTRARNLKFVAFDYGQLEWRVGAALSRDKRMIEELRDPQHDIHGHWTDSLGTAFSQHMLRTNRKGLRDALKNDWTFSNLYGNSPGAIAYALSKIFEREIDERMLMPHYEEFWDTYPALKNYQEHEVMGKYWALGYVETGTGQRRREPLARNEAINHPFQGTAGHLVLDAQTRISRFAWEEDRDSLQPIMNVHDDLSFELPLVSIEQDIEDSARMMLTDLFDFVDVPMLVECSVGDNWAEKTVIGQFRDSDFK